MRGPGRRFCLHIDARQTGVSEELHGLLGHDEHVHFVEPPCMCRWGTYSLVEATLRGLRTLRAAGPMPARVMLISGQDYPVVSNEAIDAFFEQHADKEFIEAFALDAPNRWSQHDGPFQAMARIEQTHWSLRSRWLHLPWRRRLPSGLRGFGGSQWWALSGACVADLLATLDERPEIERYFRRCFIPDELFFQTLVMNSRWRDRVDPRKLLFVDFTRGHPTPPATLVMDDFDLVTRDRDALLARKFDMARDTAILDRLDRWRASQNPPR